MQFKFSETDAGTLLWIPNDKNPFHGSNFSISIDPTLKENFMEEKERLDWDKKWKGTAPQSLETDKLRRIHYRK